jgi:hypothetical protein
MEIHHDIIVHSYQTVILLEKNIKASSSKRTKHINIRYFFVTDRIANNELSVEWYLTGQMIVDYMTKPLHGTLFKQFRDHIMGVDQIFPTTNMAPTRLGPQECVGKNSNMTGTSVKASTNIKVSDPLPVGDGTDVTRNNIFRSSGDLRKFEDRLGLLNHLLTF